MRNDRRVPVDGAEAFSLAADLVDIVLPANSSQELVNRWLNVFNIATGCRERLAQPPSCTPAAQRHGHTERACMAPLTLLAASDGQARLHGLCVTATRAKGALNFVATVYATRIVHQQGRNTKLIAFDFRVQNVDWYPKIFLMILHNGTKANRQCRSMPPR